MVYVVAIDSKFGWLLFGPIKQREESAHFIIINVTAIKQSSVTTPCTASDEQHNNLHQFWDFQSIPILEKSGPDQDFQFFLNNTIGPETKQLCGNPLVEIYTNISLVDQPDNFNKHMTRLYCLSPFRNDSEHTHLGNISTHFNSNNS